MIMGLKLALVSVALYFLLRGSILLRLRRLMEVTKQLTAGNYAIQIEDAQDDEIGQLTLAFNRMTSDLRVSQQQIASYNRQLEERVQDATAQLQQAYEDLKSAQSHLVLNEKMASLGVLIAGVAHEINTPVGAILNVSRTLEKHLATLPANLESLKADPDLPMDLAVECLKELRARACESRQPVTVREQRAVETALRDEGLDHVQERMAVLCRLNFIDPQRISRFAPCLRREEFFAIAESYASIAQAGSISQTSSQKIGEIVRALKYYAYSDNERVEMIQINDSIATALVLLRNQLKHAVNVETEYGSDLPMIPCTSEIHQAWTNLLTNACDAIAESGRNEKGVLVIRTWREGETVVASVTDNGIGIPPDKMDRIFDPFYTTKDIGKGTGLGLSIVSGIIKRHHGAIRVESRAGQTTFEITLPIRRAEEAAPSVSAGAESVDVAPLAKSTRDEGGGPNHDRLAA
jgi:signal transduction histidine kinase